MSSTAVESSVQENGPAGMTTVSSSASHPATAPTASLYVGELQPDVTEAMLYDIFNQLGPVSSIRICRDAITRRSLGYAYVNYHNVADGERALESLNYSPIRGKPCRIMWSQRDPSLRRSGAGNVFIKNLNRNIDNKTLHDTFSAFGNILSCKVATDESGNSKGYGFIHFETQESADEAAAKVNGMLLNDIKVYVGRHLTRRERLQHLEQVKANFTNVFIKNLDPSVTNESLVEIFRPFGEILSAVIQIDENGLSKGFGFVNFADHEEAQHAVDALNGRAISGREVYVGRAQKKAERVDELRRQFENLKMERLNKSHGTNVYIKNLADTIDDERLKIEFSPFGTIISAKVMLDERNNSRGFGFVSYSVPEEAARAVTEMNSRMLLGKPLYVAVAQRKEERRAQLEAQYAARTQQLRFQQQAAMMGGMLPPPMMNTGAAIFQQGPVFVPPGVMRAGPGSAGVYASGSRAAIPIVPYNRPMNAHVNRSGYQPSSATGGPRYHRPQSSTDPNHPASRRSPYISRYAQQGNGNNPGLSRYSHQAMMYPYATAGSQRTHVPMMQARTLPPLDPVSIASMPQEQQKRLLGERLYPLVHQFAPEQASKITGMLLELSTTDVLELLNSSDALIDKIQEAQDVLSQHSQQQPQLAK